MTQGQQNGEIWILHFDISVVLHLSDVHFPVKFDSFLEQKKNPDRTVLVHFLFLNSDSHFLLQLISNLQSLVIKYIKIWRLKNGFRAETKEERLQLLGLSREICWFLPFLTSTFFFNPWKLVICFMHKVNKKMCHFIFTVLICCTVLFRKTRPTLTSWTSCSQFLIR